VAPVPWVQQPKGWHRLHLLPPDLQMGRKHHVEHSHNGPLVLQSSKSSPKKVVWRFGAVRNRGQGWPRYEGHEPSELGTSWNFLHIFVEGTPQVLGFLLGLLGEQSHIPTLWRFSSHPWPTAHFGMGVSKNGRTCCIHKWHSSSLVAETGGNFSCS